MGFDLKSLTSDLKQGKTQTTGPATRRGTNHRFFEPREASVIDAFEIVLGKSKTWCANALVAYGAKALAQENKVDDIRLSEAYIEAAKRQKIHLASFEPDVAILDSFIKAVREDLAKSKVKPAAKAKAKQEQEAPIATETAKV